MHGIHVDYKGNVWLGGNGAKDSQILKFTKDGKFLMQSGHQGKNAGSNDPENFGRVAQITVNPKTNEAFVADGYRNKRVAVLDGDTGKIKRFWGAYGNKPDDSPQGPYNPTAAALQQYRSPVHCVALAKDDLLYVCDRQHDRVQVFKPDGTFLKEQFFAKNTLASGSTWEIAFSKDPAAALHLSDRRAERARAHRAARHPHRTGVVRPRRTPARRILRRAQHRRGFQGQHLHDRNLRRKTRAEVRLQGHRQGAGRRPGRRCGPSAAPEARHLIAALRVRRAQPSVLPASPRPLAPGRLSDRRGDRRRRRGPQPGEMMRASIAVVAALFTVFVASDVGHKHACVRNGRECVSFPNGGRHTGVSPAGMSVQIGRAPRLGRSA